MTDQPRQDVTAVAIKTLEPQVDAKPAPMAEYVIGYAKRLLARVAEGVSTPEQASALAAEAGEIKKLKETCEAEKTAITTPLYRIARAWGARWKPAVDALGDAERQAKQVVLDYQLKAKREAMAALEGSTTPEQIEQVVRSVNETHMGSRDVWRFQVIHAMDIPARYWKLDTALLDADVKAAKGKINIRGGIAICDKIAVMLRTPR